MLGLALEDPNTLIACCDDYEELMRSVVAQHPIMGRVYGGARPGQECIFVPTSIANY